MDPTSDSLHLVWLHGAHTRWRRAALRPPWRRPVGCNRLHSMAWKPTFCKRYGTLRRKCSVCRLYWRKIVVFISHIALTFCLFKINLKVWDYVYTFRFSHRFCQHNRHSFNPILNGEKNGVKTLRVNQTLFTQSLSYDECILTSWRELYH